MFSTRIFKKYCAKEWLLIFETHKKSLHFKAGQKIFNDGDAVSGIFFVEKGKVKVLSKLGKDNYRIVRLAGSDTILGHRGLHYRKYHFAAEAITDTTLTFLPIDLFVKIIKTNPGMAVYLINFLAEELREAEEQMKNLSILDPKKRIAIILIRLIDSFGYSALRKGLLAFTLKRADIANMANTTYETVIRTLSHFEEEKLIKLVGKEIAILDEKALRGLVQNND